MEQIPNAFSRKRKKQKEDQQKLVDELYRQIGQLKIENYFLKKTLIIPAEKKRNWLFAGNDQLSMRQQTQILGLNRSSLYYKPIGIS